MSSDKVAILNQLDQAIIFCAFGAALLLICEEKFCDNRFASFFNSSAKCAFVLSLHAQLLIHRDTIFDKESYHMETFLRSI